MELAGPPDGAPSVHWRQWRQSHIEELREDPLLEFFVWWWADINDAEAKSYLDVLNTATSERPLQKFLEDHPRLLVQHMWGDHGRWMVPQKRLGAEYVPDFVIGEKNSLDRMWTLVELQSPSTKLFTKKGRRTTQLDEGIEQILSWRRWLAANRDYARRPPSEGGLGLTGITDQSYGLVLIGRAGDRTADDRERLKQLNWDLHIQVRSYDWLYRVAENRIAFMRTALRGLPDGIFVFDDDNFE
jgi:hypothetical protein